jgi:hypothetical protein
MLCRHVLKYVLRQLTNLHTKEISQTIIKVIHDKIHFITRNTWKYFTKVPPAVRYILHL